MPKLITKRCATCKYARKEPTLNCACNDKVKLGSDVVQMKENDAGWQYCDGYKPEFKG